MNKEQIYAIVRYVLMGVGTYLVSKGVFDETTWTAVLGGAMAIAGLALSVGQHGAEATMTAVRAIIVAVGAVVVSYGLLDHTTWMIVSGALMGIASVIWSVKLKVESK